MGRQKHLTIALLEAIKNATSDKLIDQKLFNSNDTFQSNGLKSFTTDMLDSETEPLLMIEDVSMPEINSQNPMPLDANDTDSLQNLCEAISNRQKIEEMMNQSQCHPNNGSLNGDESSMVNQTNGENFSGILIANIAHVDNLITKLFKILQIIQMENVNYVEQLELNTTK